MPEMHPTPAEEHEDLPGPAPVGNGSEASLRERAEQAERQRDEYFSLLRQAQADFENAHQRNRRERDQQQKYRGEQIARDLLPAIDNLERALETANAAADASPLAQGVVMARDQLLDALKRNGVVPMKALGEPFDPNLHEAVMQHPTPDKPANSVVQVLERGYLFHERVLRPARVIISSPLER